MIELIAEIPQYQSFRNFSFPRKLPLSLTFNLTNRCNCHCKTCRIYDAPSDELSLEEITKIFKSFRGSVYWLTLSGGEPFLREDLDAICISAHHFLRPRIITIPTNAILTDAVCDKVGKILEVCRDSTVIVNMSLDGVGDRHDDIRGKRGSFESFLNTYRGLRGFKHKNFRIGINTTLSRYNAGDFPSVLHEINKIDPDSHLIEYAQTRFELNNHGMGFEADKTEYARWTDALGAKHGSHKGPLSKVTRVLRGRYYKLTKKILKENKRALPCFAGFSSAHISSGGNVWACGIAGDLLGSLRKEDYDFRKVWFGKKAVEVRKRLKRGDCFCVSSNITYQNMLFDVKQLSGFCFELIKDFLK